MAFVVDLDMGKSVLGDCRLVGVGPILDTISCEDPHSMMCLVFHVVDSSLDKIA